MLKELNQILSVFVYESGAVFWWVPSSEPITKGQTVKQRNMNKQNPQVHVAVVYSFGELGYRAFNEEKKRGTCYGSGVVEKAVKTAIT